MFSFKSIKYPLLGLAVLFLCLSSAGAADERGLWNIWTLHEKENPDHNAVIAACNEYLQKNSRDPLRAVSETLKAWHLMKKGQHIDAHKVMLPYSAKRNTSIGKGANKVAAAWLTRIDREKVRLALQFYYRKKIGYPENLEILANYDKLPPAMKFRTTDRWGKAWKYKLVGFTRFKDMLDQKYRLHASRLGLESDLNEALKLPYGDKLVIKALRVQKSSRSGSSRSGSGSDYIEVAIGGTIDEDDITVDRKSVPKGATTAVVAEGLEKQGVYLAYVGSNILVFCNRDYWEIVAKPR